MPHFLDCTLLPREAMNEASHGAVVRRSPHWMEGSSWQLVKRSIDARSRQVIYRLRFAIYAPGEAIAPIYTERGFRQVDPDQRVIIIGAGPAGLFAALQLIAHGIKPVVLERGKDVRARRRDLVSIHREHRVNPDSNYCFGEGGAGTYSDGKLYTRSTKRGDVQSILQLLVQFGADPSILIDAHPHIGTNKLPGIIAAMREQVLASGGEVHFGARVTALENDGRRFRSAVTADGSRYPGKACVLATGHSARDIFSLLQSMGAQIEFKSFALGVRAEHPQELIDRIQYHCEVRDPYLPPAPYSLVHQAKDRGVYSFCMCPGGIIAPCATAQEEIVTNGWSPSKRNNPWANSGIVVPVSADDARPFAQAGALMGMEFQRAVEQACWKAGGSTQVAPAQRMTDFVEGRLSRSLPECSYQPGIIPARLDLLLPPFIAAALREGFRVFGKKMKGYYTDQAVLVGPESRTSSPVRIPRDKETLEHPGLEGFYPCGEGAGYAGGIVSAAIDGENVALRIVEVLRGTH